MALLPWHKIETVLLDMDGTLLDLHFDNEFWLRHLPKTLAKKTGRPLIECEQEMQRDCAAVHGQLEWYCLDYWADKLDLDIMEAKREIDHLIQLRPDAVPFLDALKASNRQVVLVTNAHPDSLSLKVEKTALDKHIDTLISTHQFGVSKESQNLWKQLQAHLNFEPEHTLFVDDSQSILDAAKTFGIAYTLGITNPDLKLNRDQQNKIEGHPVTNDYRKIINSIIEDNFSAH